MSSTEIEKESLEAHVELCAERYKNLDNKLNALEGRLERLEELTVQIKDNISEKLANSGSDHNKQLINIAMFIIGGLGSALFAMAFYLLTK